VLADLDTLQIIKLV